MKKYLLNIFLIIFTSVLIWAGYFYWENLRGISPAVKEPAEDIAEIIEKIKTGQPVEMPLPMPPNFSISIYAKDLIAPRVLSYDPAGNLMVSIPLEGKVVALKDENGDGFAEKHIIIAESLNKPHGLAARCDVSENPENPKCQIYIAESDQVAVYDYDKQNLKAINKKKIVDLPGGGNHFTRTIMFTPHLSSTGEFLRETQSRKGAGFMPYPDHDRLLISVGSSCNACNEKDFRRAKILSVNFDGSDFKTFAQGLRNSVFMAIHPVTGKIWATEMGRDFLGDNLPPDEINIINEGGNYGWPICYGKNIHDTNFDKNTYIRNPCMEPFEKPSYIDIPAHSAPLGLAFFPEEGWPEEYWYNLLVAYHGSWNRSEPTGYKIVRYKLDAQGNYLGEEDFVSGWFAKDGALGRPVDILIQPGGVIYVSDDKAGVIYKVVGNF